MKTEDQRVASDDAVGPTSEKHTLGLESLGNRLATVPVPQALRRVLGDRSVRAALFSFTLSRFIVLLIFVVVGLLNTSPDPAAPGHFDVYVSLNKVPFARILHQEVMTADVNWYVGIAERGYEQISFNADVQR